METFVGLVGSGLLGGIFGGLLRLAPEVLKFLNGKADRAHELAMTKLQMEASKQTSDQKLQEIRAEGDAMVDAKGMDAFVSAIKGQGKLTGIRWIDGLSQSVRPVITYWWMGLYTAVKIAMMVIILGGGTDWANAFLQIWTTADMSILAGIINFWFLDRVIRRQEGST